MSSLSEKMISEFVESTTPAKEERSHEFTIYGTVQSVDNNGVANVLLDGGEVAPCQTTVGCSAGDRVIVSFKNREPVVTSNISKPTATISQLNAEVANINTVMAQKATITQLNTEVANINNVVAQKATITQLNTEVANINNVVAQKATITYVDSKTVSAVNVFATNGTFSGTLSAAKGVFNGKVTISWEDTVPVPTSHVEVCTVTIGNSSTYPISITRQDKGSYIKLRTLLSAGELGVDRLNSSGSVTARSSVLPEIIQVGLIGGQNTQMTAGGVNASDGSRLISSSEISTLSNVAGWINRGAFTGNLNSTSITPGFYRVGAGDSYSGTKPSPAPSWCLFIQSPAYNTQIFIDASDKFIAFRDYTGNPAAWGSWRKITAS